MKKFFILLFILLLKAPVFAAGGTIATYVIDPEKMHLITTIKE